MYMSKFLQWIVALSSLTIGAVSLAADPEPLAIKGYDPVAYFTAGKPTPGRADITLVWDEHRYQFATAANRDRFKADPVRYAPQFSDYCAMALSKGEIVVADPENWTIADGKLYIFGKAAGPGLFTKDTAANIAKAEGNRTILPKR
jgi:hypothetical protein